ncbi:hypothetical protein D3C78_560280 [compost metagenome]
MQEAEGNMVTARTTPLGLILYTTANAVSVIYSGNADFPWNFKSIPGAGGISKSELVSVDQTGGFHQAYTTNGIQQIGHTGAKTTAPQITDFISGKTFEDYNAILNEFTVTKFNWSMQKQLNVVADRYLVVSYGLQPLETMTHALVLDLVQGRMGKFRMTHNYCFELTSLTSAGTDDPRGNIALLDADGTVRAVNFGAGAGFDDSVLLLGKYQYVRQRMLELFEVEMENVETSASFQLRAIPTLNGKTHLDPQVGYLQETAENYRRFTFDGMVGTNISLALKGKFNLMSLVLWFAPHGRR